MLAAVSGTLVLASACSDGGGTPPPDNVAPVANFNLPACTINVDCTFTSTSTDDDAVTGWTWDFNGDGTADATTESAVFRYGAAGTFSVILTVRDTEGLTHLKASHITIAPVIPVNTPPTAGFTNECQDGVCTFTNTSTDAAPGTITTYLWSFGDNATSADVSPTHSYNITAETDFTITLTVTDNDGAIDVETQTVSVPPNTPPTAGFTYTCSAANCSFTSTSIDAAPGSITTYAWNFGDGGTSAVSSPSHRYVIVNPRDFTVTLTVTDDKGATDVETQTIAVSPPTPGAEGCRTLDIRIDCLLDIDVQSIIKLKLIGLSCTLNGQRIVIPPPSGDQVFLNVCERAVGDSTKIFGGISDRAFVFEAGSQATIRFVQGTPGRGDPIPAAPAAQLTGSFPTWTINFEDGAHPGDPGEPDFADVVLLVEAVPPHPRDLGNVRAF
jgi:PKD repeat protein